MRRFQLDRELLARAELASRTDMESALDQAGLLELVDTTQVRGAVAHHYRARVRPRASAEAWAAAHAIAKQSDVGAALQTIDESPRKLGWLNDS